MDIFRVFHVKRDHAGRRKNSIGNFVRYCLGARASIVFYGLGLNSGVCILMLTALIMLTCIPAAPAATIYINGTCGDDTWTGTNPNCLAPNGPKATIQAGINIAGEGDTVQVAIGTYNENISFSGVNIAKLERTTKSSLSQCATLPIVPSFEKRISFIEGLHPDLSS